MKDVMSGKRNGIKQENVKVITVPYFKGLKLEAMFDFSRLFAVLVNTFPQEERERDRLPRDYVANVIYTVVGQPFQQWVN